MFDIAISLDQKNAKLYNNKGTSLLNIGQFHEAHIMFDKAIKLDPNDSNAYFYKGLNYLDWRKLF